MTIYQLRKSAEEMEVSFKDAALCRLRYIRAEMHRIMALIDSFTDTDPMTALVADIIHGDTFMELAKEQREIVMALREKRSTTGTITDAQVEQARAVPVTSIIEFQRGRAVAWCHPDKTPSLYYAPRINKAACPVCGRYFNAIDVLVERDGLNFAQAVQRLAA